MATYKQGSSQDLLQTLSSYLGFPTPGAARALQTLLTQRREILLHPLSKKAKSAEDRKKVTSKELELGGGTKRAFGDDFVERVKALSDALDLNEIVCSELLLKAESSKVRYGRASLLEIAESIFFEARQATLKTLQMLFTARQNAHQAGDTGILISQFTTELLDGGLFHVLLNTIKDSLNIEEREAASLNPPRTATGAAPAAPLTVCVAQWDHQRTERHMVAEIIFTICYTTTISPDQAKKLLEVIQALAIKAASLTTDILQHHGLYQTCYTLIASLIVLLDVCNEHDLLDVRGDKTRSRLFYDTTFIKEFDTILQQPQWQQASMPLNPTSDPASTVKDLKTSSSKIATVQPLPPSATPRFIAAQQTIKLAWASFLRQTIRIRRSDPSLGPAHELFRESNIDNLLSNLSPAFLYLAALVKSELFENDSNFKTSYVEVFDELVRGFLTTSSLKAKEMKREEENGLREEAAYRQYPIGPKPPKTIRNFDHFLQLISALYQGQPTLAARYWSEEYQPLVHFVRGAGDNLFESNFVSYLKMLSALSSGELCAQHTFHFLQESSRKYTNWDYFFNALHEYYLDLQQPLSEETGYYDYSGRATSAPARTTRQISPDEVESLEAILNVAQSVLRYSPVVRESMLSNPDWRVMDALFHLLTCPIPMSLKASLTRTITQFARDPSAQTFVWQYMDAANLLGAASESKDSSKSGAKGGASSATTVDAAGIVSGGGIIFELSEIESKEEHYPYTLAFVELLNTLLTNHYHESRDTLADINLWPYIQFLIKDVFQRFDQRAYINPNEKWHIARAALKVFLALLRDSVDAFSFSEQTFSVAQYASLAPGGSKAAGAAGNDTSASAAQLALARYGASTLKLYRYFLSRTELLKKVIAIVCAEGQANLLMTTRSQSKDSALEDCVRYSLMIFETVLLRQGPILSSPLSSLNDDFGAASAGSSASNSSTSATPTVRRLRLAEENTSILVPLHTILLRKMSDLAALALYVTYPYNTTIARLSVSIVHLLSRDTDKLALILHDQDAATDFVNGYIDKLQTDDLPSRNQDQVHYRGAASFSNGHTVSLVAESTPSWDPSEMDDDSGYWASRAPSIREAILALLLECATQPEYNLTQLLFGMSPSDSSRIGHHSSYSFNRHLERAAGAASDSAATLSVLPTILRLLGERTLATAQPKLASLMYELLYTLLKRPNEFGGVGRSLRSSEFFRRQFAILDVSLNSASIANQLIFSSEQHSLLLPSQIGSLSEEDQAYVLQQLEQELYGPLMEQRAWLLKSVALELHTTCGTNRTYATHLLDVLYTTQFSGDAGLASGLRPSSVETSGRKRLTSGTLLHQHTQDANGMWQDGSAPLQQQRMKMRELLDALEIPLVEPLPIVQGSVFFGRQAGPVDASSTSVELVRCTEVDARGFSAVDLRLLYGQLVAAQDRLRGDYTLSPEQSADMIAEETVILRRAVAWNRFQQVLKSQCRILEAWREVLEVSLIECYHLLDANSKETVLYELLETLLSRLNHSELRLQVGQPLTSCILMLTAKLRQLTYHIHVAKLRSLEDSFAIEGANALLHHHHGEQQSSSSSVGGAANANAGDKSDNFGVSAGGIQGKHAGSSAKSANGVGSGAAGGAMGGYSGGMDMGGVARHSEITEEILATAAPNYLPVEQLLVIQKGLTAALLRQGTTLNMRGNLYAALLNYLQFTQRSSAEVILLASSNTFGDFWASDEDSAGVTLPQQQHQQRQLYLGTLRQLHAVSERLMEVIAADASDAPHLFRSIAFAVLDALCTYECSMYAGNSIASSAVGVKWLSHLTRQGLLRYFLESLVQYDDGALSDVLHPTADSLNDLYVYESKMAMLLSMAATPNGAASLVESGLLQVLAKFTCIDHPHQPFVGGDSRMDTLQESWMRPVHERYEQILLPSLRVLVAVMTQMPRNADVAAQTIDFVESHSELISILLKDRGPAPSKASLQLLCLVSSVFYHLVPHDSLLSTRLQVQASKFHHLLVQLLAKYADALSEVSRYSPFSKQTGPDQEQEPLRAELLALLRNLSGLVRRLSVGATTQATSNLEAALAKPGKIQFSPSVSGAAPSATPAKSRYSSSATSTSSSYNYAPAAAGSANATTAAQRSSSQREQPPLTVLIVCLSGALTQLASIKEESSATIKKLQSVHQCKSDELLTIIRNASSAGSGIFGLDTDVDSLTVEKSTTFQLQQAVQHILGVRIAEYRFRTSTLYQIIENSMFVLWRHLSYYLADEDTSKDSTSLFLKSGSSRNAKFDKATLQRETSSSLGPLYPKLDQLTPLSHHQTHIIPSLVRRLKDVLGDH